MVRALRYGKIYRNLIAQTSRIFWINSLCITSEYLQLVRNILLSQRTRRRCNHYIRWHLAISIRQRIFSRKVHSPCIRYFSSVVMLYEFWTKLISTRNFCYIWTSLNLRFLNSTCIFIKYYSTKIFVTEMHHHLRA